MARDLVDAPEIKEIVLQLKERYPVVMEDVNVDRILFRRDLAPKSGKKKVFAYVQKVNDLDKDVNPNYDFHFIVNDDNVKDFTPGQLHVLCLHESLHIGPSNIDDNGIEKVKVMDHDIKEFSLIGDTFGYHWHTDDLCRDPLADTLDLVIPEKDPEDEEA